MARPGPGGWNPRIGRIAMDISKLAIFKMAKMRLDWSAQRQKVLSENIANADTPNYRAHDLKSLNFKNLAMSEASKVAMVRTDANHLKPGIPEPGPYREVTERFPYESSADGNEVVLEEQMSALSETKNQYNLSIELVKKHLNMIKIATRAGR
ncbi:flagellar basal body rod protein FlgB [Rhodospirillum rubrum]|nr:flagellar basal body rod protein FlgB [Rhodospirillum rubrum]MBK1677774.1 flagellar basal body rod protein FlgB [Rhodospirillum rubrum]